MTRTYYDVLEVNKDASQSEIREAAREKMHEYHPDVSDHPDAKEHFFVIKEANEVLTDSEERERYDRLGHEQYLKATNRGSIDPGDTSEADEDRGAETESETNTETETSTDTSGRAWGERDTGESGSSTDSSDSNRSSAADEYRNRRRRSKSRSRSDRQGRGDRSRRQGDRRSRQRSENESESKESTGERETAGRKDDSSAWDDPETTSRGFGQPASEGMFVSPDIELLRIPGLLVLYFIGFETGLGLFLAASLIPAYGHYRRHKFTERLLYDDLLTFEEVSPTYRRLIVGAAGLLLVSIAFAAVSIGGVVPFELTSTVYMGIGLFAFVTFALSAYSLTEILLYDWLEADHAQSPLFWDVGSRLPALLVPFVALRPDTVPAPTIIISALLLLGAGIPIAYIGQTYSRNEVSVRGGETTTDSTQAWD